MSVTAHFRGGPLDGVKMMLRDAPPTYLVPVAPPKWEVFDGKTASERVPHHPLEYRRIPGVMANEVVYELQPVRY